MSRALRRMFCSRSTTCGSWPMYRSMMFTASFRMSSTGKATALWMASTLSAAVEAFSACSSSSVFRATATSRVKISRNCRSLSLNARGSGLSTLNVPITSSCNTSGTVSELLASPDSLPGTADRPWCPRTNSSCRSPPRTRSRRCSAAGRTVAGWQHVAMSLFCASVRLLLL